MSIKRIPADDAFSLCVRERAHWTCELCGTVHAEGQAAGRSRALDNSHLFGRGNWSVRFDSHNAFCHCTACHFRFGADRDLQYSHYTNVFGAWWYDIIMERKEDTKLGRLARKSKKEIKQHYMAEFEKMREMRKMGIMGRIEFENWI